MTQRSVPGIDRLALGAALVTVVLWASAFVGIRAVAVDLTPGSIALGRLAIGTLVLGVLVMLRPWQRPSRRDLILIVASGLLWFAFYNLALNEAERNVDAGTASMLVNMGPIFLALLAGLFLGEGLPARLLPAARSPSAARSSSGSRPRHPRRPRAMRRGGSCCASLPRSRMPVGSRFRNLPA